MMGIKHTSMPGKPRTSYPFFVRQLENAGFVRGFKLMEINVATAVFQAPWFSGDVFLRDL